MFGKHRSKIWTIILWILLIINLSFLAIQFVPVEHTNPAVVREPDWDSPQTRLYAKRVCFDCHSNETRWPWYAYLAPISWRVTNHVQEARFKFNISDWSPGDGDEAARLVATGKMPLWDYLLLHPDARLSDAEREAFMAGLRATFENK